MSAAPRAGPPGRLALHSGQAWLEQDAVLRAGRRQQGRRLGDDTGFGAHLAFSGGQRDAAARPVDAADRTRQIDRQALGITGEPAAEAAGQPDLVAGAGQTRRLTRGDLVELDAEEIGRAAWRERGW